MGRRLGHNSSKGIDLKEIFLTITQRSQFGACGALQSLKTVRAGHFRPSAGLLFG
jgi:hypothetical protein